MRSPCTTISEAARYQALESYLSIEIHSTTTTRICLNQYGHRDAYTREVILCRFQPCCRILALACNMIDEENEESLVIRQLKHVNLVSFSLNKAPGTSTGTHSLYKSDIGIVATPGASNRSFPPSGIIISRSSTSGSLFRSTSPRPVRGLLTPFFKPRLAALPRSATLDPGPPPRAVLFSSDSSAFESRGRPLIPGRLE